MTAVPRNDTAPVTLMTPRVLIPFLLVTLIWGSTWIVIRDQLGTVPPSWSVAYRFGVAALAMLALALVRREALVLPWRVHLFALALGLAQFLFNFNFVYRAELHITSGLVAVLFALLIVPNSILGRVFLGLPLRRGFVIGAGIAVIGVGMMILHQYRMAARASDAVLLGTWLTLLGVLSASIANVMQGSQLARAQSMIVMLAFAMLYGALANAAFAWATVGPPVGETRIAYWLGVGYLGIFASAVAFPLYFGVIRAVGPGPAAWSSVLVPIIAMAFSTVLEGYEWTLLSFAGALLALAGLVIALRR